VPAPAPGRRLYVQRILDLYRRAPGPPARSGGATAGSPASSTVGECRDRAGSPDPRRRPGPSGPRVRPRSPPSPPSTTFDPSSTSCSLCPQTQATSTTSEPSSPPSRRPSSRPRTLITVIGSPSNTVTALSRRLSLPFPACPRLSLNRIAEDP
jgi:hypothetical protein